MVWEGIKNTNTHELALLTKKKKKKKEESKQNDTGMW